MLRGQSYQVSPGDRTPAGTINGDIISSEVIDNTGKDMPTILDETNGAETFLRGHESGTKHIINLEQMMENEAVSSLYNLSTHDVNA